MWVCDGCCVLWFRKIDCLKRWAESLEANVQVSKTCILLFDQQGSPKWVARTLKMCYYAEEHQHHIFTHWLKMFFWSQSFKLKSACNGWKVHFMKKKAFRLRGRGQSSETKRCHILTGSGAQKHPVLVQTWTLSVEFKWTRNTSVKSVANSFLPNNGGGGASDWLGFTWGTAGRRLRDRKHHHWRICRKVWRIKEVSFSLVSFSLM